MAGWRRLLRDLLAPDAEFVTLDPVVVERELIRGAEATHRIDVRHLQKVIVAKKKAKEIAWPTK